MKVAGLKPAHQARRSHHRKDEMNARQGGPAQRRHRHNRHELVEQSHRDGQEHADGKRVEQGQQRGCTDGNPQRGGTERRDGNAYEGQRNPGGRNAHEKTPVIDCPSPLLEYSGGDPDDHRALSH